MAESGWMKPDEVMKQMRQKKKALQARFRHAGNVTLNQAEASQEEDPNNDLSTNNTAPVKRKNPFKRSPAKRPKLLAVTQEPQSDLFGSLLQPKSTTTVDDREVKIPLPSPLSIFSAITPVCPDRVEKQFVVDWSLKTRARFTSRVPHNFSSTLKTSEEASGITGFVRCTTTPVDTSTNAQFHQCCLVWQHPWLPWLSLFPRDVKTSSLSTLHVGMDPSISNCLINDWCESFRSLFGLLRARQCPYFYVCTHQFNVLFRAAGIGGVEETHALLTPTTRGLRDILQREDITFSMPLKKKDLSGTDGTNLSSATDSAAKEELDDDEEEEEEEDDEWINDIGLHSNLRSKL
nr:EOG090X09DI [Chydorus sphaericus]